MTTTITAVEVHDVRFPTAAAGDGSDAINRGDYSATYVELRTDAGRRRVPASPSPTAAATRSPAPRSARWRHHVVGRTLEEIAAEPVAFWRSLTADPQLRWLGPEKGVIHMATGALVNAVWDLRAKAGRQADVAAARRDADRRAGRQRRLPPHHRRAHPGRGRGDPGQGPARVRRAAGRCSSGTASRRTPPRSGWLGYPDDKVRALTRAAYAEGWRAMKMKVGGDARRRRAAGPDHPRGDRPGRAADDGRQPGLGRRRGDRQHGRAGRGRPVLDRGAHARRRRARPRPDRRAR